MACQQRNVWVSLGSDDNRCCIDLLDDGGGLSAERLLGSAPMYSGNPMHWSKLWIATLPIPAFTSDCLMEFAWLTLCKCCRAGF